MIQSSSGKAREPVGIQLGNQIVAPPPADLRSRRSIIVSSSVPVVEPIQIDQYDIRSVVRYAAQLSVEPGASEQ